MTDDEHEPQSPGEEHENDLLKTQEGKGYGEDEGEREAALDDDEQ